MTELRFDDRVAVITGAGRGLGRAYALLLASKGAKVVVNDPGGSLQGDGVDAGPAQAVVDEIGAAGGEAVACTESVATPAGGKAIVQAAMDRYGRIDILIHNAGNVRYGSLKELSYEDFESVLSVHLRGAFHVVRPAFPLMCSAGYGRIVLTSSIGGLYGNHRVANYGVSKAGIIGLCNVAALEGAAQGVRCNVIVPGAVTRMAEGIDTSQFPGGHRYVAFPADGAGTGGARRRVAVARILFGHGRDVRVHRRSHRPRIHRRERRRVSAVVDHRAGGGKDRCHPRCELAVDPAGGAVRSRRSHPPQLRDGDCRAGEVEVVTGNGATVNAPLH